MNADDESSLSAYLDGQLDPSERQAVEAAILSDPALADKLRVLCGVSNLVSTLSRTSSPDVSGQVMRRVADLVLVPRPWSRFRRALPRSALGLATTAAAAFLMLLISRWSAKPSDGRSVAPPGAPSVTGASRDRSKKSSQDAATSVAGGAPSSGEFRPAPEPSTASIGKQDRPEPLRDSRHHEVPLARGLLDDPSLRQVFMVTDVIDDPSWEQLTTVLKQSTRHEYYRITVSQGIVIDPQHPGEATVFALVLEDSQLNAFRARLEKVLSDRVEEHQVEPAVVAQLADIGQVLAIPPDPVGDVIIPDSRLAQLRDEPTLEQERSRPGVERGFPGRTERDTHSGEGEAGPIQGLEGLASQGSAASRTPAESPAPPRLAGPEGEGRGPAGSPPVPRAIPRISGTGQPVVVLVWVTRRASG